jgi:hypothetical protein
MIYESKYFLGEVLYIKHDIIYTNITDRILFWEYLSNNTFISRYRSQLMKFRQLCPIWSKHLSLLLWAEILKKTNKPERTTEVNGDAIRRT